MKPKPKPKPRFVWIAEWRARGSREPWKIGSYNYKTRKEAMNDPSLRGWKELVHRFVRYEATR